MKFSNAYSFTRTRQLEGTYPGDPSMGVWPINWLRIACGWGRVSEDVWPDYNILDYGTSEPPDTDRFAKSYRMSRYQRIRDSRECRKILAYNKKALSAVLKGKADKMPPLLNAQSAFEITEQFVDAPNGVVSLPELDTPIIGSHAVLLLEDLRAQRAFSFINSWGRSWGDKGFGTLPYDYFDRYIVEAWTTVDTTYASPPIESPETSWEVPDPLGDKLYGFEYNDVATNEKIGWAFAVQRDSFIDVEELYVRPQFRRQGYGRRLAERISSLARNLGRPLRAWIPFADSYPENRQALVAILRGLRLSPRRSNSRWAAFQAIEIGDVSIEFESIQIPARPAYSRETSRVLIDECHRRKEVAKRALSRERLSAIIARLPDQDPWLDDKHDWEL